MHHQAVGLQPGRWGISPVLKVFGMSIRVSFTGAQLGDEPSGSQKTVWVHFAELFPLCRFPVSSGSLSFLFRPLDRMRCLSCPLCWLQSLEVEGWKERKRENKTKQQASGFAHPLGDPSSNNRKERLPFLIVLVLVELQPPQPLPWISGCKKMSG